MKFSSTPKLLAIKKCQINGYPHIFLALSPAEGNNGFIFLKKRLFECGSLEEKIEILHQNKPYIQLTGKALGEIHAKSQGEEVKFSEDSIVVKFRGNIPSV